jgi:acyl-CoA synthetase (NDP forming)
MKEAEVYRLLDRYGISHPQYRVFKTDEKPTFDTFPCVLKIHSGKVVHKSDVGGVITGISDNKALEKAKQTVIENLRKNGITLDEEDGFIVEEQIKGLELFIGGVFDPIFEEVLLFGKGGTLVEIEKDVCYIDIKADETEIKKAVSDTKISKIFPSFRGKHYDIDAVVSEIKKFQKMFENEDIKEFDINPFLYTGKGLIAVDARIKQGKPEKKQHTAKNVSLFENSKIAILGATDKQNKVGYAIAKNSLNSASEIYFVNPKLQTLFGKKVYNTIDDLPGIDTAVIAIPSNSVLNSIKQLIKKGCKNFIVISAGFKEIGNVKAEKEMSLLAKKHNLNIVGPNCLGIYNSKYNLNLTFAKSTVHPGKIGLISQSGAVLTAIMDKAAHYKIGFSHIISMGNMADFNFANAIDELNRQDSCEIISVYAEGLQYGKAFLESLRKSKKPILLFKAGKSKAAKKAAFSHTGNIAGNYEMIISLSKNAGSKIKDSMESLIFAPRFDEVNEVVIVTNAGGPGTILTDLVSRYKKIKPLDNNITEKLNAVLPPTWSHNNPVDVIGDATAQRYDSALKILAQESELIYVIITPQFMTNAEEIVKILVNYDNAVPILLGKEAFKAACDFLDTQRKLYFTSLEESSKIL